MALTGPRKADPVLDLRRVFVWSSGNAQAAVTNRTRKCTRAVEDLDRIARGLGGRYYKDPAQVRAKVEAIARDRRVGDYLRFEIGADAQASPTLAWHFDWTLIDAEAATDGWYALLTNLSPAEADAAEVLAATRAKRSWNAATAISKARWPSPPCILKSNRRIEALDQCDLPGPAGLLPRRTSGAPSDQPGGHHDRALSRTPGHEAHRATRLRRPRRDAAHPSHRLPASSDSPAVRCPAASPAPARRQPARPRLKQSHRRDSYSHSCAEHRPRGGCGS